MPQDYRTRAHGSSSNTNHTYARQSRSNYSNRQMNEYSRQNMYQNDYDDGYEKPVSITRSARQSGYSRTARNESQYAPARMNSGYSNQGYPRQSRYDVARTRYGVSQQPRMQQRNNPQSRWDRQTSQYGMDYEEDYMAPQMQPEYPQMDDVYQQAYPDQNAMPMTEDEPAEGKPNKWVSVIVGAIGGAMLVAIVFIILYFHETGMF